MSRKSKLSRREFFAMAAVTSGSVVLAACGATPTATPVPTATKAPAAPTTAPAPAAATATTAPAAATATKAPVAAATNTAAPAAAATAAPAGGAKLGANLIGKLEGYEVQASTAKPAKVGEAPMLADLVKSGKLPAAEMRIPDEPCITKPLSEVGKYGGTLRRGFTGPGDGENGNRMVAVDKWIFWDYTGTKIIPSLAKAWKVADDGKSVTISLRKGAKWSDGTPYTADDCMFWFEDIYGNKDLTPTPLPEMSAGGKPGKMVKIDDTTIAFQFENSYPLFEYVLAGDLGPGHGQAVGQFSTQYAGGYAPKKYLSKFLPKYTPQADLDAAAKAASYTDWKARFQVLKDWERNPDLPVMAPWHVTASDITKPQWVVERNPYYWELDTAGNQLPYLDKIQWTLGENVEVINLRAIAGEFDQQERHLDIQKLPVFLENQQKGGYTVHLDPALHGADAGIFLNFSFVGDAEIAKWIGTRDFRRALSMGVDRDQLNEAFWLGLGTPGSVIPSPTVPEYPGDEWKTKWSKLDVAQANSLLDKIGLDKKDASGMRLRADGKGALRVEIQTATGSFLPYGKLAEMIAQQWKKIGITLDIKDIDRTTWEANRNANQQQLTMWSNGGTELFYLYPAHALPVQLSQIGPEIYKWYASAGSQGTAPVDPDLKAAIALYDSALTKKTDERNKIAQDIWKNIVDNCLSIGTVGLSVAFLGLRVTNNKLGNIPARHINAQHMRTPTSSRPTTIYFKS